MSTLFIWKLRLSHKIITKQSMSSSARNSRSLRISIILEGSENEEELPDGPLELPLEDYETEFYNIELAHEAVNELLEGLTQELDTLEDSDSEISEEKGAAIGQFYTPKNFADPIVSENKATQSEETVDTVPQKPTEEEKEKSIPVKDEVLTSLDIEGRQDEG